MQEEGLYVVSGKCTFDAGGMQSLQGTPGTFVSIPGDTEHSFTVDEPNTHVLNFYLPARFKQLLIGIARPATERKPPPKELIGEMMSPPWLAEKLAEDYGQTSVLGEFVYLDFLTMLTLEGNSFVDKPDPAKMVTRPLPGATMFPFIPNKRDFEHYTTMNGRWAILASGPQIGGSYCLLKVIFRRGLVIAPQIYADKDEMFYVLEGEMTLTLDNRTVTATKGALIYVPSGHVYSVKVVSENCRCLNLYSRSGLEDLVILAGTKSEGNFVEPKRNFREKDVDAGVRERLLRRIGLIERGEAKL
jgi:quercetin dioxygenase-like cupin family protein